MVSCGDIDLHIAFLLAMNIDGILLLFLMIH